MKATTRGEGVGQSKRYLLLLIPLDQPTWQIVIFAHGFVPYLLTALVYGRKDWIWNA